MRIAIDARKLRDYGIGTYIRNLLRHLSRLDDRTEYVLLCRHDDCGVAAKLGPNFRAITEDSPPYSLREQMMIPMDLRRVRADLFHAPHYVLPPLTPCPSVVTIHDCIHLRFPQYLPNKIGYAYARGSLWAATHQSSRVVTVSEASKRDILHYFNVPESKIDVIYNAIDERFNEPPSDDEIGRVRERYQLNDPFVLYAGNIKPHKNLERLIEAFSLIRRRGFEDVKLLIIGDEITKYATLRRAVHRLKLHKHVRFFGFVPDQTLAVLYRLAAVFVFPSLYEGFGLPPLEAMASGTPVITSNVSSLPEVVGDAAILIDPYDPEAIAEAMARVLSDDGLRRTLIERGLARAFLLVGSLDPPRPGDLPGSAGRLMTGPGATPVAPPARPRVAIVHDWLTGMRGGEKVLEAICGLYPGAPIYTLVRVPGSVSARIEEHPIVTSPVQRLPAAGRLYRSYLPLFPAVVEMMDLDRFDLILSSSHCAVKSVVRPGHAVHVSYCHSPMRYAWDQFDAYFGVAQVGAVRHALLRPVLAGLARWDRATAGRVDAYLANSRYVAARIRRYYNRGSTVVYPPVDTAFYRPATEPRARNQNFLVVSALVPYKRLEIAIEACRQLGAPLTVVGRGPEEARLRQVAGDGVTFLGWRSDDEIRDLYQTSRAVLLPGIEDFGMVPVEAQACGCPVVALGVGGARETVQPGVTGTLAEDASIEAFAMALEECQRTGFDEGRIRANAEQFSKDRFTTAYQAAVQAAVTGRDVGVPTP